jgi:methylamine dehydrogenase light chain
LEEKGLAMKLPSFSRLTASLDSSTEAMSRHAASSLGRRSFLSKMGTAMVGAAVVPMLPFDRSGGARAEEAAKTDAAAEAPKEVTDQQCEYWRYCALDGFLCTCCGGSLTSCPPGADASKVSWVGTCQNPKDGKSYLITYNDCCGKTSCGRCVCNFNLRERPAYRMGVHNDINWCMADTRSTMYHCTVAAVVGISDAG